MSKLAKTQLAKFKRGGLTVLVLVLIPVVVVVLLVLVVRMRLLVPIF